MKNSSLYKKITYLPDDLKAEVIEFIDYLLSNKVKVNKNKPKFGSAKGKIHMADDFDAPLDDFKNYMK